ncbi:MAG: DUF2975 domain-containing protein [Schleiferilactobacillus harbinensis]|nr:DUF2975 domain-containing protein [Schleiferilactobacillus harbinensis]
MKIRSWLLQLMLVAACLVVTLFAVFLFPRFPARLYQIYGNQITAWFFGAGIYGAAVSFYVAAWLASRLLFAADHNQAFTTRVVQLLRWLKWSTAAMTLAICGTLPQIYVATQSEDAPGMMLIGLCFTAVPLVVTIFLAILQRLWQTALQYKEEHDLTI